MEAAVPSSSKVILQCTDPSGLLDQFQAALEPRTPLKNLHWKSPSRPLRSIPSLNVSLVRKEASPSGAQSNARRHQIPGLRETPYVKLYLLRCDDKEAYKETARKEIKQWIKDNTLEKESKSSLKNHEHHDAFEWMIVHVVVPGTQAASQPQSSKHISVQDTESTDSVNSKSKWTGKSSSTIHDKLRADFSSSKLPIPRVAQVRLTDPAKPPGALGPSDIEEQWKDFVDNLKASILKSFDTRVAQYEDDIREREGQRNLPGWNFCTFFILKEGLARGFENVGLLEDALAVYSELEAGLDSVVQEQSTREEADLSGALLPFSNDLKTIIRQALDAEAEQLEPEQAPLRLTDVVAQTPDKLLFDAQRRKLREMILANNASPLEIRTHIFTRQREILLRQAKTSSTPSKIDIIDIGIMADLADLALNFMNLGSRELRADVQTAWGGRLSGEERAMQKVIIGNVVASWSWAAVTQILGDLLPLADVNLSHFEQSVDVLAEEARLNGHTAAHRLTEKDSARSSRNSSPIRGLRTESLSNHVSLQQINADKAPVTRRPAYTRLSASVARLFLLLRKTIENLPSTTSWVEEMRNLKIPGFENATNKLHRLSSAMTLPMVNGDGHDDAVDVTMKSTERALDPPILRRAISSREEFHQLYSLLSKVMLHLFVEADNRHSARQVLIDLAMLAFIQADLAYARQCIAMVIGTDAHEPLMNAQSHVLAMYAECLRQEHRPNDLAECLLASLHSPAAHRSPRIAQAQSDELAEVALRTTGLRFPLDTLAEIVRVDRTISHVAKAPGFSLSVDLRGNLPARVHLGAGVTLQLKAQGFHDPQKMVLVGPDQYELGRGVTRITLSTHVNTEGWYELESIQLRLGEILFNHNFSCDSKDLSVAVFKPALSVAHALPVLVYPSPGAGHIDVQQSETVDLDHTRCLTIMLNLGGEIISDCTLQIRAATAGLRLHLHDARISEEHEETSVRAVREQETTVLRIESSQIPSLCRFDLPYTTENASEATLTLKCVLKYNAGDRPCVVYQNCHVQVSLPVSVSVQDVFRDDYWYSQFMIAPTITSPIILVSCLLEEHDDIKVESGYGFDQPTTVFAEQPARWTVRSRRKRSSKTPLRLNVRYRRLDEISIETLRHAFLTGITEEDVTSMAQLLETHLTRMLKQKWTEQDLEIIALTNEIETLDREDMNWPEVLRAVDKASAKKVDKWLTKWHAQGLLPVQPDFGPLRELRLSVKSQPIPPVATTGLKLAFGPSQTTAILGQPLTCELFILLSEIPEGDIEFTYELFTPADAWLIGGRKRGLFSGNELHQALVLFPQKVGHVLLPGIDIRCRRRVEKTSGNPDEWTEVPIEVYNQTISKSVQVTSNLQSTTIGLLPEDVTTSTGDSTAVGHGVLLQSQARQNG